MKPVFSSFFASALLALGLYGASALPVSAQAGAGQAGYDPQNTCEYTYKWICRESCLSSEIEEKNIGGSSISCGLKAQQGKTKCCHAKNFKTGPSSPQTTSQMKDAAQGKSQGELISACAQAGGVCQGADPALVELGVSPCSGDQQISAFCSADGTSICCTKAAAQVNTQISSCIKAGGSCYSGGSCPDGTESVGICDSSQDAFCCRPIAAGATAADAMPTSTDTAPPPPPNPFDDKKPAGFDTVKSYYGFQDPLNLQGTNKFSKFVNRIISFALPVVGTMFLVVIVYSGILWLSAGGDAKQLTKAKTYLTNAVIGMMLVVFSYALVTNLINYFGNAAFGPS